MKNEQKYNTAEERIKAFSKFCDSHDCESCEMGEKRLTSGRMVCAMNWLALEAEDEKLENCPFCCGETYVNTHSEGHEVRCKTRYCYVGKTFENKAEAVAEHNRIARAVRTAKESEVRDE